MIKAPVRITGVLEFEAVKELEIALRADAHGEAFVKGTLTKACYEARQSWDMGGRLLIWEAGGGLLFSGFATRLRLLEGGEPREAEVSCATASAGLDSKPRQRMFQDIRMTYGQVADMLAGEGRVRMGRYRGEPIGSPLIQYDETDWAFLLRLAARLGASLIPAISGGTAAFLAGPPTRPEEVRDLTGQEVLERVKDLPHPGLPGREVRRFQSGDGPDPGDWVAQSGFLGQVFGKRVRLRDGELEVDYEAGTPEYGLRGRAVDRHLAGMAFAGTVHRTEQEMVELAFDMDAAGTGYYPFPYLPETGNVLYSMPEKGARACLYLPDGREEHGIVIHALPGPEEVLEDPRCKDFATPCSKRMRMAPSCVRLEGESGDDACGIVLDDRQGARLGAASRIHLKAGESIYIRSGRACSVVAGTCLLACQAGTVNQIEMSGNDIVFQAERYACASRERVVDPEQVVPQPPKTVSCEFLLDHLAGGIPVGLGNQYENAVLGGIPTALTAAGARNLCGRLGRNVRK